jgi:hypothetical protein
MVVAEELASSPQKSKSQRRLSAKLGIKRSSLQNNMRDMNLYSYRPRLIYSLNEDDFDMRVEFAEKWLQRLHGDPSLEQHIVWSDEAKFHVSGTVNRHNSVYWRSETPNVTVEYDNQSPGVMVWAGVSYHGPTGPFFFDGNVTGATYLELLENEVAPVLLARDDYEDLWWQQDGCPPHYAVQVRIWLDEWFPNMWFGRRGPIEWPARSPDLTPADFFLWGHLKNQVYKHPIQNVAHLRQVILEFNSIPMEFSRKACENVKIRLQACIDMNGAQLDHYVENR